MSDFVLVMDPEHLEQIDKVRKEFDLLQYTFDDIVERYNCMARAVWERTLAGQTTFTEFHWSLKQIAEEWQEWLDLRDHVHQLAVDAAIALPELTELRPDRCIYCIDGADCEGHDSSGSSAGSHDQQDDPMEDADSAYDADSELSYTSCDIEGCERCREFYAANAELAPRA
ncbi:hypothetical protein CC85DRAFT_302117 [Cutaneotrichosporon oleaginosum]|uniref:Uncharacterized protein n=1 Tax=Cutaneotrichosporon oleaginosum TaxID=879819 RepID=A0A0J0XNE5_9TREE|nr:uncharacterized protein CC85DRAFT_302117 [Cutaneotrichosporon oleaginosum]KLT42598.1 hypothetical protein CC85DRAFT_302117 [Cutaneotrichosporon oleaginosum]TXT05285.1 hypothetical protein COLE_06605 [Cutaneotrichosporon oleaginosum]